MPDATESQYPLIWAAKEAESTLRAVEFGAIYEWEQSADDTMHRAIARQKVFIRRPSSSPADYTIIPRLLAEYYLLDRWP